MQVRTDIMEIPAVSFRELNAYVAADGSSMRRWTFSPSVLDAFRFRVLVEMADASGVDSGSGKMRCRDGGRVPCGWRGERERRLHWALWHPSPGLRAHLVLRETPAGPEGTLAVQSTSKAYGGGDGCPSCLHEDAQRLLAGISPAAVAS